MENIALIAPTYMESVYLRSEIHPSPCEEQDIFSKGHLHRKSIIFSHCGVGKVNAAHSTTIILENHEIGLLILFGIAGGYPGVQIGDVVIAESENYGEEGVMTDKGWKSMEFTGFPLLKNQRKYFNSFPLDAKFSQLAINASIDIGLKVDAGHFITVSQCSGTGASGEILQKRFNGLCENMEGAAAAHICAKYGIPMIEIRGISNIIEDRDLEKWNIPLAASNCNKAVSEVVRRL